MSEILHGVLNMPPELWCNDEVSILQRHSCYLEASRLIKELEQRLAEAEAKLAETEKALRWVCDVYIVGHYYSDDQRKEQLERTVRRVMVKANVGEEE